MSEALHPGREKVKTGDFSAPSPNRTPTNREIVVPTLPRAQDPAVLSKNERRRMTLGHML